MGKYGHLKYLSNGYVCACRSMGRSWQVLAYMAKGGKRWMDLDKGGWVIYLVSDCLVYAGLGAYVASLGGLGGLD